MLAVVRGLENAGDPTAVGRAIAVRGKTAGDPGNAETRPHTKPFRRRRNRPTRQIPRRAWAAWCRRARRRRAAQLKVPGQATQHRRDRQDRLQPRSEWSRASASRLKPLLPTTVWRKSRGMAQQEPIPIGDGTPLAHEPGYVSQTQRAPDATDVLFFSAARASARRTSVRLYSEMPSAMAAANSWR
jgi:hypothetical protein